MTLDELKAKSVLDQFSYDQSSGDFTFLKSHVKAKVGGKAGTIKQNGYRHLHTPHGDVQAHRAAFLFMTGRWPAGMVDHANGDRSDNRWCNLRLVTPSGNSRNCSVPWNSESGIRGVRYRPETSKSKPWSARIKVNGSFIHLGVFTTKEDALAARIAASKKFHGDFCGQIVRGKDRDNEPGK